MKKRWNDMILDYLYNIIESLKIYNNKWYAKPYVWYKKRKLKKILTFNNITKIPLTKNFLLDLMQFSDLTGIFEVMDRERVTTIKLSDKLVVSMPNRNNIITVKYTDLNNSYTIITKEYHDVIAIDNTYFRDTNAIKLENMIYNTIYEKINDYIAFIGKEDSDETDETTK